MATSMTVVERYCLLPSDDNGKPVQVLGAYVANKDVNAPNGDVKESAIVAITNTVGTATQLTDSTKIVLVPGGIYTLTLVGLVVGADSTWFQVMFSQTSALASGDFTALPAAGATNAIAGDVWPAYADPHYTFVAKTGQVNVAVMVRGSVTTNTPYISVKRLR